MRKLILFAGIAAMGLLYGCGNDSTVVPEPEPGPPVDSVIEIPGEPLPDYIRPVLTEGKRWVKRGLDKDSVTYSPVYTEYVAGDTVIDGTSASIIIRKQEDKIIYTSYMTESGSVVYRYTDYIYYGIPNGFAPIYDCYGTSEDLSTDNFQRYVAVSRGIIVLQGKQRRCTKILSNKGYQKPLCAVDYWVEGIGPLFGMTPYFWDGPFPSGGGSAVPNGYNVPGKMPYFWINELLECYDGDEKIYDYREFSPDLYHPIDTLCDNMENIPPYLL